MRSLQLIPLLVCTLAIVTIVPASAQEVPTFESDIRPLFAAKCFRCHGPDVQKGELALNSRERIEKGGEGGEILTPGKPEESRLYEMVLTGEMPSDKKNPFTEKETELLKRWIEGGAKFGSGGEAAAKVTEHDVLPILLLRCTACHGRAKQEGGLDLRSRETILKGGKSGPALVLGKPAESLLVKRVAAGEMPPHKRLIEAAVKPMEPDELEKIKSWIAQGALPAAEEPDLAGTADDPLVRPEDREFWSFKPPMAAKLPDGIEIPSYKGNNFVDVFIRQKLSEQELTPSPEAAPLVLLRRAYFDLTGLPPTPEEAQAFLVDASQSPDAFEKLIDRLLASPRYGERWGRHWLDVAGYADCEGRREQHLPRPFAWRYRDYVIRAFNADKPYDRFLIEQLAGDELADYEHAAEITQELEDNLVATAFLRMAPDPTWANLTGFVPDRLEVLADEMDVLGSGVMGLTFKCARCHTHKFDPIPQRDYYRLLAIFKGAFDEHDWLRPEIKSFGGAYSAGPGERYLPFVTSRERQAWQAENTRIDAEIVKLKTNMADKAQAAETDGKIKGLEAHRPPEPRVMALWDRGEPSPMYMYRRGNYQTPGAFVSPGVPAILTSGKSKFEIQPPWPGAKATGRRLAFAKWLTQPDQPLTARVFVNRLWKHHFGQGIVKSLGNFGKTGDKPTHPELLDTLAVELVRQDWSPKALHRKMLHSRTWRQSSAVTEESQLRDSDGRQLSHMPLRRMEAEPLRDALLYVAGELDESRFGPAEPVRVQPDGLVLSGKRRSIYVQQLRKQPPSLLESFDLPSMNPNCLQRSESLVATQALHLMNDASVRGLSEKLAERIIRETAASRLSEKEVERLYWIVLNRPPSEEELRLLTNSLEKLTLAWEQELTTTGQEKSHARKRALATVCHTLLNSADFLYVD